MKGLKFNSESNVIFNAAGHKTVTARAPVTLCGISQSNDLSISLPNRKLNNKLEMYNKQSHSTFRYRGVVVILLKI